MNRDFKGVWIPKEVWLDRKLSLLEKFFLVEIDSLDNKDGCFASNDYFSNFFYISKSRCTQVISSLKTKGYITVTINRKGSNVSKRIIKVFKKLNTPSKKLNTVSQETKHPYLENCEYNNTSNNNTKNNTTIPTFEEFKTYGLSKEPNLETQGLKFKYEAWKENGWKNGFDKPIKNWKTTLLNTIPHLKKKIVTSGLQMNSPIL